MPRAAKNSPDQKGLTPTKKAARRKPPERQRQDRSVELKRGQGLALYLGMGVAVVAGVAVALATFFLLTQIGRPASINSSSIGGDLANSSKPVDIGRQVPDQGRDHVTPGQSHPPYNSNPPTSGWHYASSAPWGIHDKPIDEEAQVHNLEHGGIMVQYWCPDNCPDLTERLKEVVSRYPSKVILAPYAKPMPNRIALTAWNWIDTFDGFDEQRIVSFIAAHKNRGPEQVPD